MEIGILSFPRVGGSENLWLNGIFDSFSIIVLFPLIVYMGASGEIKGKYMEKACRFPGDISYPIYIIHYPLMYIFNAWVVGNNIPMSEAWPVGILLLLSSIAIAYGSLKLYDIPVRNWLTKRFKNKQEAEPKYENVSS